MFYKQTNMLTQKITEESLHIQLHCEKAVTQLMDSMLPAIKTIQEKMESLKSSQPPEPSELSVAIRELNAAITTLDRIQEDSSKIDAMNALLTVCHDCQLLLDSLEKLAVQNLLDRTAAEDKMKTRRAGRRTKARHRVAVPNYYR